MSAIPPGFIRNMRMVDLRDAAPVQPYREPDRHPIIRCPLCRCRLEHLHAKRNKLCGRCLVQLGEPIVPPSWLVDRRYNAAAQQAWRDRQKAAKAEQERIDSEWEGEVPA